MIIQVAWNKRDLLTYAVGVGAKNDEFPFVYELGASKFSPKPNRSLTCCTDPNFAPLPTFPVVLALKGADQDLNLFSERIRGPAIEGLPKLDPNRIVHATQSVEILKPLPLVSGEGWTWKSRYTGVVENSTFRCTLLYPGSDSSLTNGWSQRAASF